MKPMKEISEKSERKPPSRTALENQSQEDVEQTLKKPNQPGSAGKGMKN